MKFFTAFQIKDIDRLTILNEPISSIELMERAANRLFVWYVNHFGRSKRVVVFAGPGNNGGDGLALARMLSETGYSVEVNYVKFTDKTSEEWQLNFQKVKDNPKINLNIIQSLDNFPALYENDVVIDSIFGVGLSKKPEGLPRDVIRKINDSAATTIAIDIPSGLFCEDNSDNDPEAIIKADFTLTFQFPKLAFMFAENASYVGRWEIIPIGLSEEAIRKTQTQYYFTEADDILPLLRKRKTFDHKGDYGHGLLVAGSKGKIGAATLAAKAALRSGLGLLTAHLPLCGLNIMQTALPEAMVSCDNADDFVTCINPKTLFDAAALGPGLGVESLTGLAVYDFLTNFKGAVVLDADALNILSLNKNWFSVFRKNMVITPHPKEFDRLAGNSETGYQRYKKQIEFAKRHKCIVVLKGAFTSVAMPDGRVMFNSVGNPGMATAGSGDVLTGIILSLLAQGYSAENAAVTGVFLHGLAGDIAAEKNCCESLIASDIISNIASAYNRIKQGSN